MRYLSGLSYGSRCPSIETQRLQALNGGAKWRARRAFDEVAPIVLAEVHPGNFTVLPPSPRAIIYKGLQIGLILRTDEAYEVLF